MEHTCYLKTVLSFDGHIFWVDGGRMRHAVVRCGGDGPVGDVTGGGFVDGVVVGFAVKYTVLT